MARSTTLVCGLSLWLGALVSLCATAYSQAFGTIAGNVSDSSGAVMPGARITAIQTETSFARDVVSDESGHYIIPNLRPTQYTLTVEAAGFQKVVQSINLLANQSATLDIRLKIG